VTSTFSVSDPATVGAAGVPVGAIATATLEHVPSAEPLTPGGAVPASEIDPTEWAGAVTAEFRGGDTGSVTILVPAALLEVLKSTPIGELELSAALQPALDAAAKAANVQGVSAAQSMVPADALATHGPQAVAVPLVGATAVGAVLVIESAPAAAPKATGTSAGLEMLHGVMMEVTVELGRTRLPVQDLLTLTPGAVLELDRAAGSPVDLLVNGRLIARGEVVVVDEDFGLRVTEIVSQAR
jgi:flagellar motor switch protein FliN/FliY